MPAGWQFNTVANVVRLSLASHLVVWTGGGLSEDNRLFVSADGGSDFSATNIYEEAELGRLSGLATHPSDERTAYALFSAADAPKILRTTDLGKTWEDISGFITNTEESRNGFPDVAVYSLLVMPFDTNRIWAGTEIGLFKSLNGGRSWQYADNGLPPVSIWEMKIVNDEVVLATHGRGIWTTALPELENYEPPEAVALLPLVEVKENGLGGALSGSYVLRSDYDSVFVEVEVPGKEGPPLRQRVRMDDHQQQEEGVFNLLIEGLALDTIISAKVSVLGYIKGKVLRNMKQALVFGVQDAARTDYFTDFEGASGDFARLDFTIYREDGFDSRALHSRHPYLGFDQTYLAVLNFPVVVSPTYSLISFDEIAMIEPGERGTVFGDYRFWDFVAVEGSLDRGQSWEVIEGYDARWSDNWAANFEEDAPTVDPGLMEPHFVDLSAVFDPGDTIFLRFRLQSDPYSEGWGWVIDNLNIQQDPTSVEAPERDVVTVSAFPNPGGEVVHLRYTLDEKQAVSITLFSLSGQRLSTLTKGSQPAGDYQHAFQTGHLAAGVYLFRIEAGNRVRAIMWVKREGNR